MKEKEDKAQAELKAQEEEKKAMQEAELLREAKRREYAQKQKAKLSGYQDRVKSEAEKIQVLHHPVDCGYTMLISNAGAH